jgi:hypothetical protein
METASPCVSSTQAGGPPRQHRQRSSATLPREKTPRTLCGNPLLLLPVGRSAPRTWDRWCGRCRFGPVAPRAGTAAATAGPPPSCCCWRGRLRWNKLPLGSVGGARGRASGCGAPLLPSAAVAAVVAAVVCRAALRCPLPGAEKPLRAQGAESSRRAEKLRWRCRGLPGGQRRRNDGGTPESGNKEPLPRLSSKPGRRRRAVRPPLPVRLPRAQAPSAFAARRKSVRRRRTRSTKESWVTPRCTAISAYRQPSTIRHSSRMRSSSARSRRRARSRSGVACIGEI